MRGATYLRGFACEVVCRLQGTGDALLYVCISTIVSTQNGVLEATRVLELKGELTVFALFSEGNVGANGGNIGIVDQGNDTSIFRNDSADGALGASSTASADLKDFHLDWSATMNIFEF